MKKGDLIGYLNMDQEIEYGVIVTEEPYTYKSEFDDAYVVLDNCARGIILSIHCEPDPDDPMYPNDAAYRVLCDGRTLILSEYEFKVVK